MVNSDHAMVSVRLNFDYQPRPRARKGPEDKLLRDKTWLQNFDDKMNNDPALQQEQLEGKTASENWKELTAKVAQEVAVAPKRKVERKKPWISEKTLKLLEQRADMQEKVARDETDESNNAEKMRDLTAQIRGSADGDRREWLDEKIGEMKRAHSGNDTGTVYRIVRELSGRSRKKMAEILNAAGDPKWQDFAKSTLGSPRPPLDDAEKKFQETKAWKASVQALQQENWLQNSETFGDPSEEELDEALAGMKGKKAHHGLIPPDFFKHSKVGRRVLKEMFRKVFRGENMSDEWLTTAIVLIHKDGSRKDPKNFRPISLLHSFEKILSVVVYNRIVDKAEGTLNWRQFGFRRGRSTRHAVFLLGRRLEELNRTGCRSISIFLDFAKAFDSLCYTKAFAVLRAQGVNRGVVDLLERLYGGAGMQIKVREGEYLPTFVQRAGIRQGSSLSPLLFILILDFAMTAYGRAVEEHGFENRWLGYADDLQIEAGSEEEAQIKLIELQAACRYVGLKLNGKKTKLLCVNTGAADRTNEDAEMERFEATVANEKREGWIVDWDGADLFEDGGADAPEDESGPTHLMAWDDGEREVCHLKKNGWARVLGTKDAFRIARLGNKKFVLEEKNGHRCDKCGDYLPDAVSLAFHQATGFCRPNKSNAEQRQLRVARQVEAKNRGLKKRKKDEVTVYDAHGLRIEVVQQFTYLGTVLENDGLFDAEVARRSEMALTVVESLKRIWRDKKVTKHQKRDLYHTLVLTVALYNAEVWTTEERHLKKLRSFERRALRTIAGHKPLGDDFEENESLEELREVLRVEAVEQLIREKRVLFAAHAARSEENMVSEQMDRECKEATRWGKLLKSDIEYYEFNTLGDLADMGAQDARQKVWKKRKFYEEKAGTQRTRGSKRGSNRIPSLPVPPPTPEEERVARREREAKAEADRRADAEFLERYVNNQSWNWLGRGAKRFTTEAGGDQVFKVGRVQVCDFHGQIYHVKGRGFYQELPSGIYKSTHALV